MVVGYDTNPDLTVDQKLRSLAENIQLSLNQIETSISGINKELEKLQKEIESINA